MTAPERIAIRWEPGADVTNGPLMTHPDYTRYVREDVAQTYHDAWLTAEGMLEEAQCQIKAMKEDAAKPRVKPLVWRYNPFSSTWEAKCSFGEYSVGFDDGWWAELGGGYVAWDWEPPEDRRSYHGPSAAKAAAQADYEARILSALVLP